MQKVRAYEECEESRADEEGLMIWFGWGGVSMTRWNVIGMWFLLFRRHTH